MRHWPEMAICRRWRLPQQRCQRLWPVGRSAPTRASPCLPRNLASASRFCRISPPDGPPKKAPAPTAALVRRPLSSGRSPSSAPAPTEGSHPPAEPRCSARFGSQRNSALSLDLVPLALSAPSPAHFPPLSTIALPFPPNAHLRHTHLYIFAPHCYIDAAILPNPTSHSLDARSSRCSSPSSSCPPRFPCRLRKLPQRPQSTATQYARVALA